MVKSVQKSIDKTQEELLLRNHELIGRGLIYLAQGLQPFVKTQMQAFYGDSWREVAKGCLVYQQHHIEDNEVNLEDSQALLQVIKSQREEAFKQALSSDEISLVFDLANARRKWAHPRLRNWLDLKDFTARYAYRQLDKMLQLLTAISAGQAIRKIEWLIQEILPLLQQKNHAEDKLQRSRIEEKIEGFVGREYIFQAIEKFLNHQSNGYFIIEGDPGVGKSAILAKYVQQTGCIAHFNVRSQGINRADQFLKSICLQLISHYHLPYTSLPSDATQNGKFLAQLLNEASARLKKRERLVIAIDALDEVDLAECVNGANLLYLPLSLPKNVFFVMTQRPISLPLRVNTPLQRLDLMQYQSESLQDIKTYIQNTIKRSKNLQTWVEAQELTIEEFITQLASKSENNFMYLRYVLREIESGIYQDLNVEGLPQGLEAYYEEHWRHMGMMVKPLPRAKIRIIYVLSELREPVTRFLIAELSAEDAFTVQEVLDEWEQFLHKEQVDGEVRYDVYHASFCDFLARKDIVQAAGVSIESINATIADNLMQGVFEDD